MVWSWAGRRANKRSTKKTGAESAPSSAQSIYRAPNHRITTTRDYHAFVLAQANGYDSDAWVQFFPDHFTLLGYTISQVPISPVAVGYIDPVYQVVLLEPASYAGHAEMMEFYELIRQQTRASISSSVPEEVAGRRRGRCTRCFRRQ